MDVFGMPIHASAPVNARPARYDDPRRVAANMSTAFATTSMLARLQFTVEGATALRAMEAVAWSCTPVVIDVQMGEDAGAEEVALSVLALRALAPVEVVPEVPDGVSPVVVSAWIRPDAGPAGVHEAIEAASRLSGADSVTVTSREKPEKPSSSR
jgi:hypothetical protein